MKVQLTIGPKDGEPGKPVKITSNAAQLEVRAPGADPDTVSWGKPVDGVACAVRPVKPSIRSDEDIVVDVLYKNVSDKPVTVCVCPDPFYTWLHLWVKTAEGRNALGGQHGTGTRLALKRTDFVTLRPQQTTSFRQVIPRPKSPKYWLKPGYWSPASSAIFNPFIIP